jgi:hypothetical protein
VTFFPGEIVIFFLRTVYCAQVNAESAVFLGLRTMNFLILSPKGTFNKNSGSEWGNESFFLSVFHRKTCHIFKKIEFVCDFIKFRGGQHSNFSKMN